MPRTSGGASFWPRLRVRRPSDVGRLLAFSAAGAALGLLAVVEPAELRTAGQLLPSAVGGLPRFLLSVANVVASLALIGVLLVVAVDALRSRRPALSSAALACAVGVLAGYAAQEAAGPRAGTAARALLGSSEHSAVLPVTAAVALLVGADLQRRRHWSLPAQLAVAAAVVCALALGSLTGPSALTALLLGGICGLAVRVAVGVVPAGPSEAVVRSVLARAGWELTALHRLDQTAGQVRYAGTRPGGADLRLTVVDPDRRGVPLAHRAWLSLRLRAAAVGQPALSLRGQLERQALSGALAGSVGVAAPRVLALLPAGRGLVLVEEPVAGIPLPAAEPAAAAGGVTAAWEALRRLHDGCLALGALTADAVVLTPDGRVGFADVSAAQPAATELQRELDVVALLVAAAPTVGAEPAVAALRAAYGTSTASQARIAALLQPLALSRSARAGVRGTPLLADLRTALAGPIADGAHPASVRLERLRARTVVSIAGATVAAYVLVGQLSRVGVGSALRQARPGWLAVALAGSALTYLGAALALVAFAPVALPLARTALVQLASSFLALVTPPTVGHVGLNIRYLQREGLPLAAAAASVAVSQAVTVVVTVVVLLLCGWLSGVSASRPALLPSGSVLVVLAAAAATLALVAAAPPTRRLLRSRLEPLVRRTLPQLLAAASDPRRLATALLGVLILNGGNVLALDAALRAFSASLAVPALVVVYLAASTIGSVAPTPGGLGAVEAALVGGLTATGVPVAQALTAVLAFRVATFWLPAPIGWVAFLGLQRQARI